MPFRMPFGTLVALGTWRTLDTFCYLLDCVFVDGFDLVLYLFAWCWYRVHCRLQFRIRCRLQFVTWSDGHVAPYVWRTSVKPILHDGVHNVSQMDPKWSHMVPHGPTSPEHQILKILTTKKYKLSKIRKLYKNYINKWSQNSRTMPDLLEIPRWSFWHIFRWGQLSKNH